MAYWSLVTLATQRCRGRFLPNAQTNGKTVRSKPVFAPLLLN
jgi:hypothetical protein